MENNSHVSRTPGTHPLFTMIFFSVIIAVLVTAGSYVSKQKSIARDLQADLGTAAISFLNAER